MFVISAFLGGLLAHQTDRVLRRFDRDVAQIGRYVIGLLVVLGFMALRWPGPDRRRVLREGLISAAGVGAGVAVGRAIDRLRE